MVNHSEQINEIAKALALCQGEMSFASKDSLNPHFKSKYADLSAVWEAIREPLSKNGLSVTQLVDFYNDKPVLISILMHTSGQWLRSIIPILNANNTSQGQGAGITYVRRYALAALVGCVQDDDDGEASMKVIPQKKELYKPKQMDSVDNENLPQESIKPPKKAWPLITDAEVKEISELANKCDEDYLAKMHDYLSISGMASYEKITMELYPKIISGMKKNAQLNSKK